jgi:hypothetical protein
MQTFEINIIFPKYKLQYCNKYGWNYFFVRNYFLNSEMSVIVENDCHYPSPAVERNSCGMADVHLMLQIGDGIHVFTPFSTDYCTSPENVLFLP